MLSIVLTLFALDRKGNDFMNVQPDIQAWLLLGYIMFILINGVDLWITKVILDAPEGKEWNPVMRWIHKKLGMYGMGIIKSIVLFWLGLTYYVGAMDMFTIYYLNFMFATVLYFMYRDAVKAGLKDKLNPINMFIKA